MQNLGELHLALDAVNNGFRYSRNEGVENEEPSPLMDLPDPCLLAVLHCLSDDLRSLFSAARAHSRLHQAAVLAAHSIRAVVSQQQQVNSLMQYFDNHGQHVSSVNLQGVTHGHRIQTESLQRLPHNNLPALVSLELRGLRLQLQPGGGFQGLLWAGVPLKRLVLDQCDLLDWTKGLSAGLSALTALQHLSCSTCSSPRIFGYGCFPSSVLQMLQELTHLELAYCSLQAPDELQQLRGLTRLQHLRLFLTAGFSIKASMLLGLRQLTHLQLSTAVQGARPLLESGALAGKVRLQHLALDDCDIQGGTSGVVDLLSHLQQLQQLTHLDLPHSLRSQGPSPSAAAYSALTASSKLQHLNISSCTLPAGVWRHIFPADRQLPHLQELIVVFVQLPDGFAAAPEGSRLVSCCPGLRSLFMNKLQYSRELLSPLTGLSGLMELSLHPADRSTQGLEVVCQLTRLRQLYLADESEGEELLLQLTQLQHLTQLHYRGPSCYLEFSCKAPGDEPVWRQVLRRHLDHSNPDVAQQAAAALSAELSSS